MGSTISCINNVCFTLWNTYSNILFIFLLRSSHGGVGILYRFWTPKRYALWCTQAHTQAWTWLYHDGMNLLNTETSLFLLWFCRFLPSSCVFTVSLWGCTWPFTSPCEFYTQLAISVEERMLVLELPWVWILGSSSPWSYLRLRPETVRGPYTRSRRPAGMGNFLGAGRAMCKESVYKKA